MPGQPAFRNARQDHRCGVCDAGFRVHDIGLRAYDKGFRVYDIEFGFFGIG